MNQTNFDASVKPTDFPKLTTNQTQASEKLSKKPKNKYEEKSLLRSSILFSAPVIGIWEMTDKIFNKLQLNQPSSFLKSYECVTKQDSYFCGGKKYADVRSGVLAHIFNSLSIFALQGSTQELLRLGSKRISMQLTPTSAKRFEVFSKIARVVISASIGTLVYANIYGIGANKGLWTTADLINELSYRFFVSVAGEIHGFEGYALASTIVSFYELSGVKIKCS